MINIWKCYINYIWAPCRGYDLTYLFLRLFFDEIGNFVRGEENEQLRSFMKGYVSTWNTSLEKTLEMEKIRREITSFLPHGLLDYINTKRAVKTIRTYKEIRPYINYTLRGDVSKVSIFYRMG